MILYHYDVAIKDHSGKEFSPSLPRAKNMRIFEKMRESFPLVFNFPMSYDCNKNAYSAKLFPQLKKPQTYEILAEKIKQIGMDKRLKFDNYIKIGYALAPRLTASQNVVFINMNLGICFRSLPCHATFSVLKTIIAPSP
ncbi:hypothetical protein Avbf_10152 [Armadillidium vulgare]|nr:hypothetical protein Avbf_10152 [Armadillidium vulgare]